MPSTASSQPIELSSPIDVGAALLPPSPPIDGVEDSRDELRSDYAIAAHADRFLVVWVEQDTIVYGALLDSELGVQVPRFELHTGPFMVRTLRAVTAGDDFFVAASDVVANSPLTRLIRVSQAGNVLDSFEYGGLSGNVECTPAALAWHGSSLLLACEGGHVTAIDPTTKEGTPQLQIASNSAGGHPELDCIDTGCVAAGTIVSAEHIHQNVALLRFSPSAPPSAPYLLGYRDANHSRIATIQTSQGALAVVRSFLSPPGDIDGISNERLHGYFIANDGTITAVDPIAEAQYIRDPRLATNGQSIALAYRDNDGPTTIAALTLDGELRGEAAEVSPAMTRDVRLTATPSGDYLLAYDSDTTLLVRSARLDPPSGSAGAAGASGAAGSGAQPGAGGTSGASGSPGSGVGPGSGSSGGCGCAIPTRQTGGVPAIATLLGALAALGLRRSRVRLGI